MNDGPLTILAVSFIRINFVEFSLLICMSHMVLLMILFQMKFDFVCSLGKPANGIHFCCFASIQLIFLLLLMYVVSFFSI